MRLTTLALVALLLAPAAGGAQRHAAADRFDATFRKYTKRFFGAGFDWRLFKAQGMAESGLDPRAESVVGARGVMQLLPTTFTEIASHNPEMERIDDPEWNIAAGILYDRQLWTSWLRDSVEDHVQEFVFGSYNAGRGTIHRAQDTARSAHLDWRVWPSIEAVAPKVPRWRYSETLGYVHRIRDNFMHLDVRGRIQRTAAASPG